MAMNSLQKGRCKYRQVSQVALGNTYNVFCDPEISSLHFFSILDQPIIVLLLDHDASAYTS